MCYLFGKDVRGREKFRLNVKMIVRGYINVPIKTIPVQFHPSPVYPFLQLQVKEPITLAHKPLSLQLCVPISHSFMSGLEKKYRKV